MIETLGTDVFFSHIWWFLSVNSIPLNGFWSVNFSYLVSCYTNTGKKDLPICYQKLQRIPYLLNKWDITWHSLSLSRMHSFFDGGSCSLNQWSPSHPFLAHFPTCSQHKVHNITTIICKHGHPFWFWLLQTVCISQCEWFTTVGSSQLVQLDGENPSRLLVLAVPTPPHTHPVFFHYFFSRLHRLMIRTSLLNITSSPLTIKESNTLDPSQRWGAGPCCLPEQRSVFPAHHSSSTLSRLFNSPLLWCYLTGEGVCVCVYSVLSAVGGGGWDEGGVWPRMWIRVTLRGTGGKNGVGVNK